MYLNKKISIIVAAAENGGIGNKGELPWDIPEDLRRFQDLTMGGSVIMGRKTLESIGKPLNRRQNIILSRKGGGAIEGVELGGEQIWVTCNLKSAIGLADHEVFVIGGVKAYKEALEFADVIYLTRVHSRPVCDRFFKFEEEQWDIAEEIKHEGFSFITYTRKP